ncbi:hypothetical protein V8G54_027759 [Vigna mungo]|uniref:Uncharacterized protein n=1 Tax=Vigna mungo TaxID=3915 RepID=A0AAQ3RKA3_VIGMU
MTETNSNSTDHGQEFNPNSNAASDPSLVPSSPFYIHPSDLLRIAELQEEIFSLRQGSKSVSDYYTILNKHGYPPGHPCYPGRPRFNDDNGHNDIGYSSSVKRVVKNASLDGSQVTTAATPHESSYLFRQRSPGRELPLTVFELLHELLDDGRHDQAIRLQHYFSDSTRLPPHDIARLNSLPTADPQTLLHLKNQSEHKLAITDYELHLANEDIAKLKSQLASHTQCLNQLYSSPSLFHHTLHFLISSITHSLLRFSLQLPSQTEMLGRDKIGNSMETP